MVVIQVYVTMWKNDAQHKDAHVNKGEGQEYAQKKNI